MEEIAISGFKATCQPKPPASWLGDMAGTGRIEGDIVAPAAEETDWEALTWARQVRLLGNR